MTIWIKDLTSLEEGVPEIICEYFGGDEGLRIYILTPDTSNIG